MEHSDPKPSKSWSIYTRREITSKYQILERVGSGTYSDVYKARRLSDSLTVALKEVHDFNSAFREIDALQTLRDCPNIVVMLEYFWSDDEDAVLVLEYLQTDLTAVIKAAKKEWEGGMNVGEVKQWMKQILIGLDACHQNSIVHRDLKPSNLLISADGVLKIADFGQARILLPPEIITNDEYNQSFEKPNQATSLISPSEVVPIPSSQPSQEHRVPEAENMQKDNLTRDETASTRSDQEDPFQQPYTYDAEGEENENGQLTSCVGTRWFRSPELLYGSTNYGLEIDLWSIGCIFAELLSLEPIFPGTSDIDQLGRVFSILGNLTEEVWPGCVHLPDYKLISFGKVETPIGLEACLPNRSPDEVSLVKRLLCFDPANRANPIELLHGKYLNEEPLPTPLPELRVPSKHGSQDDDSSFEWDGDRDIESDSDFDGFGTSKLTTTENGFSIRFS